MKNIKLFLLAAAATMFAACSEEEFNSNAVTVGFESSTISYKESDGTIILPLKIEGERNGDIKVQVVATDGTAKSEQHYIMTSGDINIPANAEEIGVEIRLLDDGQEENEDRTFTLKVVSAKGAQISSIGEVVVSLLDVDANPYYKLFGTFEAEAVDLEGKPCNFTVTIDNDGDTDEKYLYACGLPESIAAEWDANACKWILAYDPDGTLTFEVGYWDGLYNFGSFVGVVSTMPFFLEGDKLLASETASATYNETYDTIEFEEGMLLGIGVYAYDQASSSITQYMGRYGLPVYVTKLTRVK